MGTCQISPSSLRGDVPVSQRGQQEGQVRAGAGTVQPSCVSWGPFPSRSPSSQGGTAGPGAVDCHPPRALSACQLLSPALEFLPHGGGCWASSLGAALGPVGWTRAGVPPQPERSAHPSRGRCPQGRPRCARGAGREGSPTPSSHPGPDFSVFVYLPWKAPRGPGRKWAGSRRPAGNKEPHCAAVALRPGRRRSRDGDLRGAGRKEAAGLPPAP